MGKRIDLFLLQLLTVAGGYLFYMGAFGSAPAAVVLTFLTAAAAGKALSCVAVHSRPPGRRKKLALAREKIRQAAQMPAAEGEETVWSVLRGAYSGAEREKCVILLRVRPLTEDELLDAWRSRAGEEKIAIAATCEAGKSVRALAAELTAPSVRLYGGDQLAQLLSRSIVPEPSAAPRKGRLRRALLAGADRSRAGRNLLVGGSLLLLYLLNGWLTYLLAGLFLLTLGGAALMRPRPPEEFL